MAKLSTLNIFNGVMKKIGEATVENLNNLTGVQLVAWDNIIDALTDICTDQDTRLKFLEANGVIPMVTGSYQYLISDLTTGSDLQIEDKKSMLAKDFGKKLDYITPQEFNSLYPYGVTESGTPTKYTRHAGYFKFNKLATATENGKNVTFEYWKLPTLPDTASPSATLDIPEPFDRTLLIPLAAMKTLAYLGNDEAAVYKMMVFGDGRDVEGTLDKLKRIYTSPDLKPRMTYTF